MIADLLLATLLAVDPGEKAQPATVSHVHHRKRGWIGIGGRNAFGPPMHGSSSGPEFGGELLFGKWFLREHLMPVMRLGWSRRSGDGHSIDSLRFGGTLAVGGALLDGRLWLGAGPGFVGARTWTRDGHGVSHGHDHALTLSGFVLGRFAGRLLLGVELGPELALPVRRIEGPNGTHRWGEVRFNVGLRIGVIFGSPIPRRARS
jgi:hypothetical protein